MSTDSVERKLAAILSADVVGYSRLMAEDEASTIRTLTDYREAVSMLVRQHRGRVVDSPGDNILAEFPTALDAVQGAVEIQRVIQARNADLPTDRRMEFRIGVHLGDVSMEGERLYGDGVNIAARLEGLADPGGICVSDMIYKQVRNKLDLRYRDLGEQELKNVPELVRVYRLQLKAEVDISTASLPGMDELTVPGFGGRAAIAVLPFDNLSGDPEQEYFADGIAEDLITRLSDWRVFPVIARNSSFTYKGKSVDVKRVSRELGVRYLVEGSVRKAGDKARISAQLIDARTGGHVWAERYDREVQDIFAVQDEITQAIVASMYPELERFEQDRVARQEPQNLDAWDCHQRGMWHLWRITKEENARARSLFERAAELDPRLASAFSGLAFTHYADVVFEWTESPARSMGEADRAAHTSVVLDNKDPVGQLALGRIYLLSGQMEKAVASFELAIRLNPSMALAYFSLGLFLASAGRPDDGISEIQKGMRLSPRDPAMWLAFSYLAFAHFAAQRYEEAIDWAQRGVQQRPDFPLSYAYLAASYAQLGRTGEARAALEEVMRRRPDFSLASLKPSLSGADPALAARYFDGLRKAGLKE